MAAPSGSNLWEMRHTSGHLRWRRQWRQIAQAPRQGRRFQHVNFAVPADRVPRPGPHEPANVGAVDVIVRHVQRESLGVEIQRMRFGGAVEGDVSPAGFGLRQGYARPIRTPAETTRCSHMLCSLISSLTVISPA